ncbi:hypothetical protein JQ617_25585 [Bradyrhizobium sp. KB893862 SZCCT0404]|uniref:hypothetical protein n=1 Tax=Bradyrhizobium sp. KB893862 SZCCT0404 TaxID=2807672 RepID=UPI001BA98371|nr:hypothetical protein [Bradyrhizobium sp. KB893862 SZCCT0404]MBR1177351.1 hypothetical protein [Bradyrhizobium sp. KB893862 SZCCT0404]
MQLSVFGVKRGLHAPQLGNLPHDPLDQAVIEIRQLNNEFLEPLNLPVEDRATIAHRLQLPWRMAFLDIDAGETFKIWDEVNARNAGRKERTRRLAIHIRGLAQGIAGLAEPLRQSADADDLFTLT